MKIQQKLYKDVNHVMYICKVTTGQTFPINLCVLNSGCCDQF